MLKILMASSFYLQIAISMMVFKASSLYELAYFPATAWPIIRLPVFFMGICAGVLCIRIQQGDVDAFHSMLISVMTVV